MIKFRTQIYNG